MNHEHIEKAKKGSGKHFMLLIEEIKVQLYKTALIRLRNEQDALDAVQEALIKAFSGIKNLKHGCFFKTWMIRIVINECYNILKYKNKVIPMDRENFEFYNKEFLSFEEVEMRSILSELDDIHREVLDLRYNQDLRLEEISELLGVPIGTVKSRLHRAHGILKAQYIEKEASL
ncbi:MAG: sigma-70 family RNA polymerase sigma factor [Bacillota bacterium]|nr:sigma-70 family RNA polymerase sigma factor [Bacillota bacterium]